MKIGQVGFLDYGRQTIPYSESLQRLGPNTVWAIRFLPDVVFEIFNEPLTVKAQRGAVGYRRHGPTKRCVMLFGAQSEEPRRSLPGRMAPAAFLRLSRRPPDRLIRLAFSAHDIQAAHYGLFLRIQDHRVALPGGYKPTGAVPHFGV